MKNSALLASLLITSTIFSGSAFAAAVGNSAPENYARKFISEQKLNAGEKQKLQPGKKCEDTRDIFHKYFLQQSDAIFERVDAKKGTKEYVVPLHGNYLLRGFSTKNDANKALQLFASAFKSLACQPLPVSPPIPKETAENYKDTWVAPFVNQKIAPRLKASNCAAQKAKTIAFLKSKDFGVQWNSSPKKGQGPYDLINLMPQNDATLALFDFRGFKYKDWADVARTRLINAVSDVSCPAVNNPQPPVVKKPVAACSEYKDEVQSNAKTDKIVEYGVRLRGPWEDSLYCNLASPVPLKGHYITFFDAAYYVVDVDKGSIVIRMNDGFNSPKQFFLKNNNTPPKPPTGPISGTQDPPPPPPPPISDPCATRVAHINPIRPGSNLDWWASKFLENFQTSPYENCVNSKVQMTKQRSLRHVDSVMSGTKAVWFSDGFGPADVFCGYASQEAINKDMDEFYRLVNNKVEQIQCKPDTHKPDTCNTYDANSLEALLKNRCPIANSDPVKSFTDVHSAIRNLRDYFVQESAPYVVNEDTRRTLRSQRFETDYRITTVSGRESIRLSLAARYSKLEWDIKSCREALIRDVKINPKSCNAPFNWPDPWK